MQTRKKNLVFLNLKSKPTMPLDRDFNSKRCIVDFFTCFKRLRFEWHCIETNQMNRNKTKHFGPKHWSIISLLIFHSLNRVRVKYKIWGSWVLFSKSRFKFNKSRIVIKSLGCSRNILTFLALKCWFIEMKLKLSSDVVQSKENPSKF